MTRDFTWTIYSRLIGSLLLEGYSLITFQNFIQGSKSEKEVILRHDVDKLPNNALGMARIENQLKVQASYYFRTQNACFERKIVKEIAELGHEIGYHYENLFTVAKKKNFRKSEIRNSKNGTTDDALYEQAIEDFKKNIAKLWEIYPVETICMHGNPMSKYDNKTLWEQYHYRDFGIIAEPYFDIDFNEVLYLTDTGRRWDGEEYSVRDKVRAEDSGNERGANGKINSKSKIQNKKNQAWCNNLQNRYKFRTTFDIIHAAEEGRLPNKMMINVHPQRWTDKPFPWFKELVFQNVKNVVKKYFYVK